MFINIISCISDICVYELIIRILHLFIFTNCSYNIMDIRNMICLLKGDLIGVDS